MEYESASKNKIPFKYSETLTVYYISLQDLIINKLLTNRPQDKVDVETLQRLESLRKK